MNKKIKGKIISIESNNVQVEISEELPGNYQDYEVIIQKPSKKRGLDANALSWTLIDRIAKAIDTSRD